MVMDAPSVTIGIMDQASMKDIEKKRRLFEVTLFFVSFIQGVVKTYLPDFLKASSASSFFPNLA